MVAKGKLKVALDAHKGVDYKKKHQEKTAKQVTKTKKSKKQEDDWEDLPSDKDENAEGDSEEESDAEEPLKVSSRRTYLIFQLTNGADRLCWHRRE